MRERRQSLGHGWSTGCLALLLVLGSARAVAAADICGYPEKGVMVVNREGREVGAFRVGLAESRRQHRRGLMGCPRLTPGSGLLFIFGEADQRVFWMKDTPLELAIIFAAPDGRVKAIARGEPYSTRAIHSPDGIQYVLEIDSAEADRIRIGDRLVIQVIPD